MSHFLKINRRCFAPPDSFSHSDRCRPSILITFEKVVGIRQNHWSACIRIGGRLVSEPLVGLCQITHLQRRLKKAQLHLSATLEDFDFSPSRGIDRSLVLELSQGAWITRHLNTIVSGPTGAGKTYLGCALAHAACRADFSVRYFRTPRFLQELKLAHADGSYPKLLASLARVQLIIFDDWMRDALNLFQAQDLLDILDDRYGRSSTMIITQVPVPSWLDRFPDPTIGDAVLDRLVNNAYRLDLIGESQRRLRSSVPMSST